MTDKEFKRLRRAQLIEIIYQLQLKEEELIAENEKLSKELEDKRIRVNKAGNIAEASLEIHNVMQAAQDAAEHYLDEMYARINEKVVNILEKAEKRAEEIIAEAEDGVSRNGITRYGQWYGNPYGEWSAMFMLFCLNYAGVPEDVVPWSPGVHNMMALAEEEDIFKIPDSNTGKLARITN